MKSLYLLSLLIIQVTTALYAQQPPNFLWAKQLGGGLTDKGYAIVLDNSGNTLTTGAFSGTADFDPGPAVYNMTAYNYDIYVSKLDAEGNFLWAKRFGAAYADYGYAIAVDGNGNVYTTGYFQDEVDFDPGPGVFELSPSGEKDIFISKLSPSGNFIWAKKIGGTGTEYGYSLKVNVIGNVTLAGYFEYTVDFDPGANTYYLSSNGYDDAFAVTLDASGNFLWAKSWGGSSFDEAYSLASDELGNIYTTGRFRETVDFNPGPGVFALQSVGYYDIFVSALDASGNFLWAISMGGPISDVAYSIFVDPNGNVLTTGTFEGNADFDPSPLPYELSASGTDFFISKLDPLGNFIWAKAFGGAQGSGSGESIVSDVDGNVFTTGWFGGTVDFDPGPGTFNITRYGSSNSDAFIFRLDEDGNFNWAMHLGGTADDEGEGITLDALGNVFATGNFGGTAEFDPTNNTFLMTAENYDIFIEKLCQLGPPTITADGPTTFCVGDLVILTASSAYSYLWSNGETTQSITITASGNYSVTVFNENGCPAYSTESITVLVLPTPPPTAIITANGPTTLCQGEDVTLSVTPCSGCTYLWSSGLTTPSITISPPVTTQYSVTVTNAAGCSTESDPVTITVFPIPTVTASGGTTICQGDSTNLAASGASAFSWSPITGLSNPFIANPIAFPNATTTYVVTGTTNGCSDTASVAIHVNPIPPVMVQPLSIAICEGSSTQLTATGATSYNWTPVTGLSNPNIANPIASPASTTTYTVNGTSNGCSATANATVTVNSIPNVSITGTGSICEGSSTQLTANGAETYSWSPGSGLSNPNISNPVASPDTTTTYTVTGTTDGCSDTASITITVIPLPEVQITTCGPMCLGDFCELSASGAETYSWLPSTGLSNTAIPNPVFTPPSTGAFTFIATGTTLGCWAKDTVVIQVSPVPNIFIIVQDTILCEGDSTILSAYGAQSYTWLPAEGLYYPNMSNPWAKPLTTTTYTVTGYLAGCADTESVTIIIKPVPNIIVTGGGAICPGQSAYLFAYGADPGTYSWSPSDGLNDNSVYNPVATPSITTTYTATGTLNGCPDPHPEKDTVTVTVLLGPPAIPGPISGPATACSGGNNTYSVQPVSEASSYTWTLPSGWTGSSSSNSIVATAGSAGGVITVKAINICGSSTAQTLTVGVITVPPPPGSISGPSTICAGGTGVYSVQEVGGATSYSWILPSGWVGSSSVNSITAIAGPSGGQISVTANNACGSSTAQTFFTAVYTIPPTPGPIGGPTNLCFGDEVIYSIQEVSGATSYTWTLPSLWVGSSSTNSITCFVTSLGSGMIAVTANNACGSSAAQTLTVLVATVPPLPGPIGGPTTVCAGYNLLFSVQQVNGATSYTWTLPSGWTGSSTTNSISVTAGSVGGAITVTANNACGSSAAQTLTVSVVPDPPTPGPIDGPAIACVGEMYVYSIEEVNGAISYSWTLPAGWTGVSTNHSISVTAGSAGGAIKVTADNACGSSPEQTLSVTVTTVPPQPGPIEGETIACSGDTITYSIQWVSGADAYAWAWPAGWTGVPAEDSIDIVPNPGTGIISVAALNECGESNLRTLSITANETPPKPVITQDGLTLTSSSSVGNQWYLNNEPIPFGNGPTYLVTESGIYSLVVTINGCSSDTSEPIVVVGVNQLNPDYSISIFPNPTSGLLNIRGSGFNNDRYVFSVSNPVGQSLSETVAHPVDGRIETGLDLKVHPSGMYFLTVKSEGLSQTYRIVKL